MTVEEGKRMKEDRRRKKRGERAVLPTEPNTKNDGGIETTLGSITARLAKHTLSFKSLMT